MIAVLILLVTSVLLLASPCLLSYPAETVERLSADAFAEREAAQAELLVWANRGGNEAVNELLVLWEASEDPEIRERVLNVLRRLSDKVYQKEGKPYLGISMTEEIGEIDGKGIQQIGIVVTEILRGSPAASSDLLAGDVIVSMNGMGWEKPGAVEKFSESIAKMKPGNEVVLFVKRADREPFEVKVSLRRCPVPNLMRGMRDLGQLEAKAQEAFFKQWMAEKRELKE